MNILEMMDALDKTLFTFIHADASSSMLDGGMKLLRNALTWIPLYAFVLYWVLRHQRKYAAQFILMTIVCFAITDYGSASILKPLFARIRPCFDPDLQGKVRGLIDCGGQFSLPSSHASNHFGLATFWFMAVFRLEGKRWNLLWLWAFAVCYAQVYVGKHFPFDIVAGAVYGAAVGAACAYFFDRWFVREPRRVHYHMQPEYGL
ncbi:phosphatase PAP2 family protein [Chitinophaga caseinilytica]|uniref:Phosphatase PAP2 family protein n=1 Tax=Chitinophaga caseinilytica TaxID=2267521 RepID=A0ABZ2YYL7_9BACT